MDDHARRERALESLERAEEQVERVLPAVGGVLHLLRRLIQEAGKDDLGGIAAQMTYYFMLALLPLMILSMALVQALPWQVDVKALSPDLFAMFSPEAAAQIERGVRKFLVEDKPSGSILFWMVPVLWAASRATRGARKGLDRVFRCRPHRHPVLLRVADLGLTLAALVLAFASNAILVGGRRLGAWLTLHLELPPAFPGLWTLLRWPISFAVLVGILMLAYRFLPGRRCAWRHLLLGAVPAALGWIGLSAGFSLWIRLLGGFDRLYGGLATFFVVMFLLWLISLIMLLGGEIAARAADRTERGAASHG